MVEGLVIPFGSKGKPTGTIWVASHSAQIEFDAEDVRLMTSLASFAGAAVHILLLETLHEIA